MENPGCFWYCRGWITTQLYRALLISCWWMLLKWDWVQRTCPGLPWDNIMKLRLKKGTKSSSLTSSSMRLSKETKSLTLALPVASVLLVFCFFTKVASFSESFWNWKNLPSSGFLLYLKVPAHGTVPRYDRLIYWPLSPISTQGLKVRRVRELSAQFEASEQTSQLAIPTGLCGSPTSKIQLQLILVQRSLLRCTAIKSKFLWQKKNMSSTRLSADLHHPLVSSGFANKLVTETSPMNLGGFKRS